jgi:murein DD-endopeptidase MepM/ murein hydrolase activator NlpD
MSGAAFLDSYNQNPIDLLPSAANRLSDKLSVSNAASAGNKKSELKKIAQEFEAVFIGQLLKVMRETIEESGLTDGGFGKSIYTELFDQETSLNMARHGTLGIADILYKSLERQTDDKGAKDASAIPSDSNPLPAGSQPPSTTGGETRATSPDDISDLQLPVHAMISSSFGLRKDPFSGQTKFHQGIDLAAPEGMTVVAALPGKVISAGYESGYGNAVLVEHAEGIRTRYGHLASINVKPGDLVTSENSLGTVGNTGHSTGPHLHFEVIRMGKPVDPLLSYNPLAVHAQSVKAGS